MEDNNDPTGFYFSVLFKGDETAFQEISGISKELSVEEVVTGGENLFKYRFPANSVSQNLVLKRGIASERSALVDWCSNCMESGQNTQTCDVSVSLLDANGEVLVLWTFHKAYPVKYSLSDLKSEENAIVIESIELAYNYFDRN